MYKHIEEKLQASKKFIAKLNTYKQQKLMKIRTNTTYVSQHYIFLCTACKLGIRLLVAVRQCAEFLISGPGSSTLCNRIRNFIPCTKYVRKFCVFPMVLCQTFGSDLDMCFSLMYTQIYKLHWNATLMDETTGLRNLTDC